MKNLIINPDTSEHTIDVGLTMIEHWLSQVQAKLFLL